MLHPPRQITFPAIWSSPQISSPRKSSYAPVSGAIGKQINWCFGAICPRRTCLRASFMPPVGCLMKILLMRLSYILSHSDTGSASTPANPAIIPPVLVPTIMSKTSCGCRPPRACVDSIRLYYDESCWCGCFLLVRVGVRPLIVI